jgi:hypothetical protein
MMPKTKQAQRNQEILAPRIWNAVVQLNDGDHKVKPQDFVVLVNAELQKDGFDNTTPYAVGRIMRRGLFRWFNNENYNTYKIRVSDVTLPRITEDLLTPEMIKQLPAKFQRTEKL